MNDDKPLTKEEVRRRRRMTLTYTEFLGHVALFVLMVIPVLAMLALLTGVGARIIVELFKWGWSLGT